eukprot:COSAG06_NODE_43331_length_373_cov_0.583942_1_plen_37_part_10
MLVRRCPPTCCEHFVSGTLQVRMPQLSLRYTDKTLLE